MVDGVVVVQCQDDGPVRGSHVIDEARKDLLMIIRQFPGVQESEGCPAHGRQRVPQRGDDVPQKAFRIVVRVVEGEPRRGEILDGRRRLRLIRLPQSTIQNERGLSETCGSGHERQFPGECISRPEPGNEPLLQPPAFHGVGTRSRAMCLRLQEG